MRVANLSSIQCFVVMVSSSASNPCSETAIGGPSGVTSGAAVPGMGPGSGGRAQVTTPAASASSAVETITARDLVFM